MSKQAHYSGVTVLLQCCTVVLQWSNSEFEGRKGGITACALLSLSYVSLHFVYKNATVMFQLYSNGVKAVWEWCKSGVRVVLQWCYRLCSAFTVLHFLDRCIDLPRLRPVYILSFREDSNRAQCCEMFGGKCSLKHHVMVKVFDFLNNGDREKITHRSIWSVSFSSSRNFSINSLLLLSVRSIPYLSLLYGSCDTLMLQ
jgi:hypothetical protein